MVVKALFKKGLRYRSRIIAFLLLGFIAGGFGPVFCVLLDGYDGVFDKVHGGDLLKRQKGEAAKAGASKAVLTWLDWNYENQFYLFLVRSKAPMVQANARNPYPRPSPPSPPLSASDQLVYQNYFGRLPTASSTPAKPAPSTQA